MVLVFGLGLWSTAVMASYIVLSNAAKMPILGLGTCLGYQLLLFF